MSKPPQLALLAFLITCLSGLLWLLLLWNIGVHSPDTSWHLATGRWILSEGSVPRLDPFCYTSEGLAWTNLNWLAQVVFAGVYERLGFTGLAALRLVLLSAILGFGWLNLRARRVPPTLGLIALGLLAAGLVFVTSIRPRLFTLALLSAFAWILARPDPEERLGVGPALGLACLLLVWNHLHGGFVYGYCLLGAEAGACAISSWRRRGPWLPLRSRWLIGVALLGLGSFALHPHGFDPLWHVANYNARMGDQVIRQTTEVLPLDFTTGVGRYVQLGLALGVLACVFGRRPRLRDVLATLPFLQFCLQMRRGVNPLAIVGLPWVAESYGPLWRERPWARALDRRFALSWRSAGASLLLLVATSTAVHLALEASPGKQRDLEDRAWRGASLPVAAVRAIRDAGGQGRVFSRWPQGGTVIWGLYPERRAHADGRTDFHGQGGAIAEGQRIADRLPGWHERLAELEVEFALLERGTPLAQALAERSEWRMFHEDPIYVVLRREPARRARSQ